MERDTATRGANLAAVVFALAFPSLLTWGYFVAFAEAGSQRLIYGAGKTIQFAFPLVWVLAFQRWRPRWTKPSGAGVVAGLLFGVAVFAAMLLLYYAWFRSSGLFPEAGAEIAKKVRSFGASSLGSFIIMGAFYSLVHSWLEEYYWRWFVFGQLRRLIAWQPALVVSSLGFMAHHVILLAVFFGASWATAMFSLGVGIGGAVWAWIYHRSGSLVGPWLSHVLADAAIFTIGYQLAKPFLAGG